MLSKSSVAVALTLACLLHGCGESHREASDGTRAPDAQQSAPGARAAGGAGAADAAGAAGEGLRAGDPVSITMVPRSDAGGDPMPEQSTEDAPTERPETLPDLSTCPGAPAALGSACSEEWQICTYGDSPRVDCRTVLRCTGGTWVDDSEPCEAPPDDYCPDTPPEGACTLVPHAVCEYAGPTLCDCGRDQGWRCFEPPGAPCPAVPPNVGSACSAQGADCVYGDPCRAWATRVFCRAGTWYPLGASCSDGAAP